MTITGDAASEPDTDGAFAQDYLALRGGVGVVELPRDVLRVTGADAVEYLQGQLSQDIVALGVGESADALLLNPQGKLDALVRVSRVGDDELILDVDGGFGDAVVARLTRFKLRVKVTLESLPWRCVALRGPGSPTTAVHIIAGAGTSLTAAFSWNGVTGVDLLGETPVAAEDVRVCGIEAWQSVRVEAGIPQMGAELDERTIAAEADLLDRTVSFTKGCYTGQELVARLDARGNRVSRHLRGLVVTGTARGVPGSSERPELRTIPTGSDVVVEGKVVGTVTSSAWSPAFGCPVALGYVHRTVTPPSTVALRVARNSGTTDAAMLGAEVRTLPLV